MPNLEVGNTSQQFIWACDLILWNPADEGIHCKPEILLKGSVKKNEHIEFIILFGLFTLDKFVQ